MLKNSYDKLEDIPENQRGAYVQKDGKFVLDDLSNDHPVVVKRDEFKTELSAEKGKVTRLTRERDEALNKSLPEGKRAVDEADAQIIDLVKDLKVEPKQLKDIVTEHAQFAEERAQREAAASLTKAAQLAGYDNPEAFVAAAQAHKVAVTFKEETVDGQKIEKPFVGDKPLADYVAATPGLKALEVAFKTKPAAEQPPNTEAGARGAAAGAGAGGEGGGKEPTYRFQEQGDVRWE